MQFNSSTVCYKTWRSMMTCKNHDSQEFCVITSIAGSLINFQFAATVCRMTKAAAYHSSGSALRYYNGITYVPFTQRKKPLSISTRFIHDSSENKYLDGVVLAYVTGAHGLERRNHSSFVVQLQTSNALITHQPQEPCANWTLESYKE